MSTSSPPVSQTSIVNKGLLLTGLQGKHGEMFNATNTKFSSGTLTNPYNIIARLYGDWNAGEGTFLYFEIPYDAIVWVHNASQRTGSGDDGTVISATTGFVLLTDGTVCPISLQNYYVLKKGWRLYFNDFDAGKINILCYRI